MYCKRVFLALNNLNEPIDTIYCTLKYVEYTWSFRILDNKHLLPKFSYGY